jgi:hypothetical protein
MKIIVSGFRGENRALHPLNLLETVGVSSTNQTPVRGDLRPWQSPLTVATVPAGRQTIYRMGRDVASDAQYWLSWPSAVHAVRASIADDTTERTYYSGDGFPKWTDNTMALASAPYPTAWRQLGIPAPASAPLLAASGGTSTTTETRFYVYTYVSDKGEEGAPSPVSLQLTCKSDATVSITALTPAPAGNYGIDRIRVYRTQADSGGNAEFFFLREVISTATLTTDDGRALGEVMPSTTWLTPPADLSGLTGLWYGMMAGITGNAVRVCEAYKPYAWPLAYEVMPADARPVALAVFGQALLVLTTGKPVLVTGGSPDALDSQPLEIAEACVSAASVVSFGHGVAWACPDGLAYYGAGGAKMITAGLMTRADWQAINPASIVGGVYEGAYLGFYTVGGVTKGFLIDPLQPTGLYFTDIPGKAVFFDDLQDQLYVLDGVSIKKWDAGAAMTATFTSKLFRTPRPTGFACAEVIADAYPVTFGLYADGVLKHTQTVASSTPFRLPSGFMAQTWQITLSTTGGAIQGAALAQSMKEMADV